jgi:hypothetical protein
MMRFRKMQTDIKQLKDDYQFNFVIEGITDEQVEELLDLIGAFTDKLKTVMGGGAKPVETLEENKTYIYGIPEHALKIIIKEGIEAVSKYEEYQFGMTPNWLLNAQEIHLGYKQT